MKNLKLKSLLVAGASLAMCAPALAGGPLAVCNSGQAFLWPGGGTNIPFNPDQGDLGPVGAAAAVALVEDAFQEWEDVPTSTATYTNAGLLPVDVDITNFGPFLSPAAPDGLSAIVFDDDGAIFDLLFGPGSGILGFAGPEWVIPATCEILEGVSFLNGPSFTNLTAALDVMVHEYGHYSNLAHTVVNGQASGLGDSTGPSPNDTFGPAPAVIGSEVVETMYPFYFGPGSGTQTLHKDDTTSLSTLYPEPTFLSSTAAISGTILAPNGTTKLTGVNVIARNIADPFNDAVSAISSDFTDSTSQADPNVGIYTIEGLTPGADYAVFVDEILAGGFSTTPLAPLPGPEEFYNGADESNDNVLDDPAVFTAVSAAAGGNATGTDIIFNSPPPGVIVLTDDDTEQLFLPFTYQLCGREYDSVWVNSNGSLTFGSGDTDFTESATEMRNDQPRIAMWWDDLNPAAGGTVSFSSSMNDFSVSFDNVPEFSFGGGGGANTFSVNLSRSSDHIDVSYGAMTSNDGIAGVSCGGPDTAGNEQPVDISVLAAIDRINLHNSPAVFEVFNFGNPNDLSPSIVGYNGTTDYKDNWAENNDTLADARRIKLPFDSFSTQRYTEINPVGGDVDFYRFKAKEGEVLFAEIVNGQLDSLIGLFDGGGNLIAADDDGGAGLLSRIIARIPADGDYFLGVTTFPDFGFTGAGGSGGRYVLDAFTADGIALDLGDDDSEEVPLLFSFPYQGANYTSVFVNSNGNLTFGSGDSDFTESVSELLNDQPRIAALWDDLSPNNGGMVMASFGAGSITISFDGVPEFFSTGSNSFDITLSDDGSVEIAYGAVSANDGIVGVTEGGGAADPGETDLSAGGPFSVVGTTYERFLGGDVFDLDGTTITFNP